MARSAIGVAGLLIHDSLRHSAPPTGPAYPKDTMTPQHHHVRRILTATAAAGMLAAGLGFSTPALAHDQLLSAEPGDGATLDTAPQELLLSFSGNLITGQGIQNLVRVTDEDGNQWQDGEATVSGPTLATQLCEGMPNGDYDVAFRVVYSDGHSEEKAYAFTVDAPDGPDSGVPAEGCGVLAAGNQSSPEQSPTAAPSSEQTAAPGAAETLEAAPSESSFPVEDTVVDDTTEESGSLPGWVWAAGFGGVAVVVLGLVVAARKAKNLG